ncbi:MAG: metallophosphoesterase [Armatimonadota bacterium]|nr:metallophosphoesterase [bacterium]MDW8321903.1 metallophosphoesterase [Armatimonadota bacterium]
MSQVLTVAHLSDTHLGYRSLSKEDPKTGVNQREVDVYHAFAHAMRAIQEASPDLVLITGDLFDKKVPSIWSLRRAFRVLRTVQEARAGKPLILLGGNHDTPRTRESSAVFPLFEEIPGIKAIYGMPEEVQLPELNASVMCVPAASAARLVEENLQPEPNPRFRFNLLAIHGVLQGLFTHDYTPFFLPLSRVLDERWDYIALGDYHDFRRVSRNAAYAGATEFTTTNIWSENREKGWVWVELEKGKHPTIRHRVVPTRRVVSLPEIDASQCDSTDEAVEKVLEEAALEAIAGALVRVRLLNLPYAERARAQRAIVERMADAFHVQVDFRAVLRTAPSAEGQQAQAEVAQPIEDRWRQFVEARREELPAGISVEEVISRGLQALGAVGEVVSL